MAGQAGSRSHLRSDAAAKQLAARSRHPRRPSGREPAAPAQGRGGRARPCSSSRDRWTSGWPAAFARIRGSWPPPRVHGKARQADPDAEQVGQRPAVHARATASSSAPRGTTASSRDAVLSRRGWCCRRDTSGTDCGTDPRPRRDTSGTGCGTRRDGPQMGPRTGCGTRSDITQSSSDSAQCRRCRRRCTAVVGGVSLSTHAAAPSVRCRPLPSRWRRRRRSGARRAAKPSGLRS